MKPNGREYMEGFVVMDIDSPEEEHLIESGWGHETLHITKDQIEVLLNGKGLGWSDGEYTHLIILDPSEV